MTKVIRDEFDDAASMYVGTPEKIRALGDHMREIDRRRQGRSCRNCRWWQPDDTGPAHQTGTCNAVTAPQNIERATLIYTNHEPETKEFLPFTLPLAEEAFLATAFDHHCALWDQDAATNPNEKASE